MTFGSLFAGIGGLDLGLERAGWECRFQVEIDPFCQKVLAKNWPNVKRYGDITKIRRDELERVDLLAGGFPCQDLSQAGKRAGIEGARSGLWFEFARLIGELRPKYVLIENVPGLLVYGAHNRVIGELSRRGYDAVWFCLRASDFGACHLRKRVFVIATNLEYAVLRGPQIGWTESARAVWDRSGQDVRHEAAKPSDEVAHSARDEQSGLSREGGRMRRWGDPGDGFIQESGGGSGERDGAGSASTHVSAYCRTYSVCYDPNQCDGSDCWLKRTGREYPEGFADLDELDDGEFVPDSTLDGREDGNTPNTPNTPRWISDSSATFRCSAFAPGPSDPRWPGILRGRPDLAPALEFGECSTASEAQTESEIRRVADGISDRLDRAMSNRTKRLSRLGNAVVPQIAEYIGRTLLGREEKGAEKETAGFVFRSGDESSR